MGAELTIDVKYEYSGLSWDQVSIAGLTDQPRMQVLSTNCGIRQVVRRHIRVVIVVIGLIYHRVLQKPRDLWGWFSTSNFADQINVTSLIIRFLDPRDDFLRRAISNSWPLWCNWKVKIILCILSLYSVHLRYLIHEN